MINKVSVVVATYNEEKYIGHCIDSLLNQNYQPLEIIVVDDGSNDKTLSILENYQNIKIVKANHQGTALARNSGVKQANGQILVFVDADMTFENNFITNLAKPINDGLTKGTFSKLEYVRNWDKPLARCWNRNNTPTLPDKLRVSQDKNEGEDFRAILKAEFLKVGGFDNTGYTDTWTLAEKLKYRPSNAPNAIYYHHNPETLGEVFRSAKWIGKRKYKLGNIGSLIAILRSFIAFSLFRGIFQAVKYNEGNFILFQIIYDLGIAGGAFSRLIYNKVIK